MDEAAIFNIVIIVLIVGVVLLTLKLGINIVPQSEVYVVERFGRYSRTLRAGLSLIIPYLDRVAHKVSILERQLEEQKISVITKDNVEVTLETRVFYRIIDASRSVYRIRDIDQALKTASSSIVRSAAGKLDLDDLQSSREAMNTEIAVNLHSAAEVWGIEITRTEITDVIVDEATKEAQRLQINAERKRRAVVTEADADQTKLLAGAIAKNGMPAIEFEVAKRQIEAMSQLASAGNSKTLILPSEATAALGALSSLLAVANEKSS